MPRKVWIALLSCLLLTGLICGLSLTAAADSADALWPEAGKATKTNGKLKIDASGSADGYFFASISKKSSRKMKMRVTYGKEALTYDLNSNADYELFPFQMGSGKYTITLYENISGKKYSEAGKVSLNVKLNREDAAFLVPSQYENYTKASEAVAKADDLCKGKSEKKAFDAVCNFMSTTFAYDYVKALTIKAGMLPDIDGSYAKRLGVCQDLAAIMVCMLRTQGIPSKLIIGYADEQYHAWTETTINGEQVFFDPTASLSAYPPSKTYTMERYY